MRDDHILGVDAFFGEYIKLIEGEFTPVRGVRHDRTACASMSSTSGTKDALLRRSDVVALSPDFADESGPDPRVSDAVCEFSDKPIGQLIRQFLVNVGGV